MLLRRSIGLIFVLFCIVGVSLAFLLAQVGLSTDPGFSPWTPQIHLSPTILAIWLPALYLFFAGIWLYLRQKLLQDEHVVYFYRLEMASYVAILLFFVGMTTWQAFGHPAAYIRTGILLIFLFKSLVLLRALYAYPQLIQPAFLVVLSVGFYLLSLPLAQVPVFTMLPVLFERSTMMHLGILGFKSLCLSLMSLETFRLSLEMTKSAQSAFFSWLIISFTFPVLGFPKMSFILSGLLLVFILRMLISRVDTKELMKGLVRPSSLTIALKFLIVLSIVLAAGLIFWNNVKPGFDLQWGRAFEAAIGTLINVQMGVFSYAPVYWLSLFGVVYLLFFRNWNGVLLLFTGAILYGGYHLAVYGMLGQVIQQDDIVPFLPFLAIFIAIAHNRFKKIVLFRIIVRLLIFVTLGLTSLLLVLMPQFVSLSVRLTEIQWGLIRSVGKDLTGAFPSTGFRPIGLPLLVWLGGVVLLALICCYIRTRLGYPLTQKVRTFLEGQFSLQQLTFYPLLLLLFLFIGFGLLVTAQGISPGFLGNPLEISHQTPQHIVSLADHAGISEPVHGLLIVSYLTNGGKTLHKKPLASITISDAAQKVETFTLKAGKDTAEHVLKKPGEKQTIAHGRAEFYRSYRIDQEQGTAVEAHEYYTRFQFSKPLRIQKIQIKWLPVKDHDVSSDHILHIQNIFLLSNDGKKV